MLKGETLIGKKYGILTVLGDAKNKGKNTAWRCLCECGKEKDILTYNLQAGKSKSCGCVRSVKFGNFSRTHGKSKTRLYKLYKAMRQRCLNSNNPAYEYYGGKGVKIFESWLNGFLAFETWSYENGYDDLLSIDRINPGGNYEPSNCRWVGLAKQQNNKLNSFFITINNEKLTLAEWSKINGIHQQTMYSKFYRLFESLNVLDKGIKEIIINHK